MLHRSSVRGAVKDTISSGWSIRTSEICSCCLSTAKETRADGGNRCYCGNYISRDTQRVEENVCRRVCMGDFRSICGGSNALSLYEVEKPESPAAS